MKRLITSILLSLAAATTTAQPKVFYVDLKEGEAIAAQPIKEYIQHSSEEKASVFNIYRDIEFQTIDGIGATFNEIGAVAWMTLPESKREEVMQNLFSRSGAALSFCRTAVGSSDFGVSAYSYSDVEGDYKMKHFSIERERNSVIPYIQTAIKYNPEMMLFASPWSPPAWMKYSKQMDGGASQKDKNMLIDDAKIYQAYALYFSKYVQAYAVAGIKIDRLIVQNETDISTKYPSCFISTEKMYELVSKYIRPQFNKDRIKTEIWAGTFRTAGDIHAIAFASNPDYLNSVDGIGIQYTKDNYINDIKQLCGNKRVMHTESKCFNGANSVAQAKTRLNEIATYINNGVTNFAYWNMILNETTESGWGWRQNSLININRQTQEVTYNPDYAVVSLLSKFMQPGCVRVASFTRGDAITIKQGDKIHLFVDNTTDKERVFTCIEADKVVAKAVVPAKSVAVIVY